MTFAVGTFIKTAAPAIVEVLGLSGLDFLAVDAEHAPFDRRDLDLMLLAAAAASIPLFVRVADARPSTILQALDGGAAGLIVPHVDTSDQAAAIVRYARFDGGERGFSNAGRFGRYGTTTIDEAVAIGDRAELICQIESAGAVAAADAIAATPGVSGLLVGRADLALSMGLRSLDAPAVQEGSQTILAAARKHGKRAGIVVADTAGIKPWLAAGADFFIVLHDQGLLHKAAAAVAVAAREAIGTA